MSVTSRSDRSSSPLISKSSSATKVGYLFRLFLRFRPRVLGRRNQVIPLHLLLRRSENARTSCLRFIVVGRCSFLFGTKPSQSVIAYFSGCKDSHCNRYTGCRSRLKVRECIAFVTHVIFVITKKEHVTHICIEMT